MLILSLKSGISTWESMGTESLLNPLVELQLLEAGKLFFGPVFVMNKIYSLFILKRIQLTEINNSVYMKMLTKAFYQCSNLCSLSTM